ncbi:MAG: PDZ domain-containing protein, partial [Trueperaceae bacterium]|nr:PDZ domain-containing protein [Trueperaceae bacterium]
MTGRRFLVAWVAATLAIAGSGAATAASPALDLFDEATYWLVLGYGGHSDVHPRDLVRERRVAVAESCTSDPVCPEAIGIDAVQRLIAQLDDGHTSYLDPEAFARLRTALGGDGSARGIGLMVRAPSNGLGLVVVDVLPGGPAARQDLRRGDRVMAIGGAFLPALARGRWETWDGALRAESVTILVLRAGAKPREVLLEPEPMATDREATLSWAEPEVALLRIPSFLPALRVAPRVHALVAEATAAGATAIIVDVRDNPGGALTDCLAASGAFIAHASRRVVSRLVTSHVTYEGGVVGIRTSTDTLVPQLTLDEPARFDGPIAVVVNGASASCAEFLALDQQGRGLVIGEQTAGVADSTTAFFALPNGAGLQVTTAMVQNAGGSTDASSVMPDVPVDDDLMVLANGID